MTKAYQIRPDNSEQGSGVKVVTDHAVVYAIDAECIMQRLKCPVSEGIRCLRT